MYCGSCVPWVQWALMLIVAQGPVPASAPATALPGSDEPYQSLAARLRQDQAALPQARDLFERWLRLEPDNRCVQGFAERLGALQTLRQRIHDALVPAGAAAVQGLAIDILTDTPSAPQTRPARAAPPLVPAAQLYSEFLPHFQYRLQTDRFSPAQQDFLRTYYNAQVRQMVDEVMRWGMPLSTVAADSHELEYYLLLLPLLHSTCGFDVSLLNTLPPWILAADRLERLADFCLLRVERIDAAGAIGVQLLRHDKGGSGAYEYYLAAADKCVKSRLPARAVQCLEAAIASLARDDPRAVEQRLAICQVWADAKNYAMAAGAAGQIIKDMSGAPASGRARYLRIRYLSQQGDSNAILLEVDDALADAACRPFEPDLMFFKWLALRRQNKPEQAAGLLKEFLRKYPDNPQAADMYYAAAVECLTSQRYDEARDVLRSLMDRFPGSPAAIQAKSLQARLRDFASGVGGQR